MAMMSTSDARLADRVAAVRRRAALPIAQALAYAVGKGGKLQRTDCV
jgi:hypothetical protein